MRMRERTGRLKNLVRERRLVAVAKSIPSVLSGGLVSFLVFFWGGVGLGWGGGVIYINMLGG